MKLTPTHWLIIDAIIAAHTPLTFTDLAGEIPALLKGDDEAKVTMAAFHELIDAGLVTYPFRIDEEEKMVMKIDPLQRLALIR
jgi:hypothetical protein